MHRADGVSSKALRPSAKTCTGAVRAHLALPATSPLTPDAYGGGTRVRLRRLTPHGSDGALRQDHHGIGVIASIAHRLPPRDYGPWEQVASTLAEGFVARGHEVSLFGTADSDTVPGWRRWCPSGYEETPGLDAKVCEALHNANAFEHAAGFDILANHFDFMPLSYSRLVDTPMLTTIHGFSSPAHPPVYRRYDDIAHYVAHQRGRPASRPCTTTPRSTTASTPPGSPSPRPPAHTCCCSDGSTPTRGRTCHRGRHGPRFPLVIAGIVQDADYFRHADATPMSMAWAVTYLGPVGPVERNTLLGGARAAAAP